MRCGRVLLLFTLLLRAGPALANQPVTFSAIGDVPYGSDEIPDLVQHMVDHNLYSPSDFLVHLGDILGGNELCQEQRYQEVADILRTLAVPAFIVPGDNEWVDCSNPNQGWARWTEHLLGIEQDFCGTPAVDAQPARPENFAFLLKGVLFIGLNYVSGSPSSVTQASADWVHEQFAAKGSQARAAVLMAQKEPGGALLDAVLAEGTAFGKPLLYIHGDGHAWLQEPNWLGLSNMLRVQVPRATASHPPVHVTVPLSGDFQFDLDPWPSGTPPFNHEPCVEVSPDLAIDLSESANLDAFVVDDGVPDPPGMLGLSWSGSGPGGVSFADPSAVPTTATFSEPGTYAVTLDADDSELVGSDGLFVTVSSSGPVLRIDDLFVNEGDQAVFTVSLAGATGAPVSVAYATADDSATAGADYTAVAGSLDFRGATTQQTVAVMVLQDLLEEPSESFFVNLSTPSGATLAKGQGVAVILDDDTPVAQYDLTVVVNGSGAVSLAPPGGIYDQGTVVTLTATPDPGFEFTGWSGDLSGSANPTTLAMDANRSVTASFAVIQHTLTFTLSGSGNVSLVPAGGVYDEGTVVTLTASADPGFEFTTWLGDLSGGASPATLAMDSDHSVTAVFAALPPSDALIFPPTADAYVRSSSPTSNFGLDDILRIKTDAIIYHGYLKFDVAGIDAPVQRATLRLLATDGGSDGGTAHGVSNLWDELGIVWDNAPPISGPSLDAAGPVSTGSFVEFDVTAAVTADGTYSFGIQSPATDSVRYSSKEGVASPRLAVELEATPPTTTTTAPPTTTTTVPTTTSTTTTQPPTTTTTTLPPPAACSDGSDNDADGLVDGADPGCSGPGDASETDPSLPCDNGQDDDGDLLVDSADPACLIPTWPQENPQCDNEIDDDGDGAVDWDGDPEGRGDGPAAADPRCVGMPWRDRERQERCGLGFELALLLPALARARQARRARGRG